MHPARIKRHYLYGMNYQQARQSSWEELRLAGVASGRLPLSVHNPLNPAFPEDGLIYCDCAFNVYWLPVPPNLRTDTPEAAQIAKEMRIRMLNVAIGEAPAVPDFRQVRWSRLPGGYPIVAGEIEANGRRYRLEYCVNPADKKLYIHGEIRSTFEQPVKAFIRFRASNPLENDVCDYHYYSYWFDASRWKSAEPALPPPQVLSAEGFTVVSPENWKKAPDTYYNWGFTWEHPYYTVPCNEIPEANNCLCLSCELQPGEVREFTLAAEPVSPEMAKRPYAEIRAEAVRYWDSLTSVSASFGDDKEDEVFKALQWCALQLLLDNRKDGTLQTCQGGSSERYYVWVWEALLALRPMLRLGYAKTVRKAIEQIIRLQDNGCPPQGEFTTTAGAIGTTGPRWTNATGSALLLAAAYMRYAEDADFEARHLDDLVRAAKWILGEVKATRRLNPDGSKAFGYGVMPACCASDGEFGYIFMTTDIWSCAGVTEFAALLKERNYPGWQEIEAECQQYRQDLDAVIASVTRPDGFIDRKLCTDGQIATGFNSVDGAVQMLCSGYADISEPRMRAYLNYQEEHMCDGAFGAPMFAGISYIGNVEADLHRAYLDLGDWKPAWLAYRTFRNFGMTQDLYLTQERYSLYDEGYIPWQPNASNNGRYLSLMIERFYRENGNTVTILGGFAPFELQRRLALKGFLTNGGSTEIELDQGKLTINWEKELPAGTLLRCPEYANFAPADDMPLEAVAPGKWQLTADTRQVQFIMPN